MIVVRMFLLSKSVRNGASLLEVAESIKRIVIARNEAILPNGNYYSSS